MPPHATPPSPGRRRAAVLPLVAVLLAPAVPALAAAPTARSTDDRPAGAGQYVLRTAPGGVADLAEQVRADGGTVRRRLDPLDTLVAALPAGTAATLAHEPGVLAVTPDATGHLLAASSTATGTAYDPASDPYGMYALQTAIGARALWPYGAGAGVDVALLDSGVARVPGLDGPDKVVDGPDLSFESQDPARRGQDTFGHGTHLAGIIAGRDRTAVVSDAYDPSTTFLGVAPRARVVSVRVADADGATDVSQVLAGISWVVQHAHDPGMSIRVLNLSFGTDSASPYQLDPLAHAAEVAWRRGIVVVTSAGNGGAAAGRLTDPAIDPYVLAVGANDSRGTSTVDDDVVPAFSNGGDGTRNPDVVAPGVHVQSLSAPGSAVGAAGAAGQVGGRYQRGSGTSQAAAVVSGAAALLLGQRPGLTPDQVKALLVGTARPLASTSSVVQGQGLVNLKRAAGTRAPDLRQSWPVSTGTGSLEGARGNVHVALDGVVLDGERDVFGRPYDAAAMAQLSEAGQAWDGGTWNGSTWAGSTWLGSTWAGSTWAGSTWAGSTWAGSTWAGTGWAGSTWLGSSWAGSTWGGATWGAAVSDSTSWQ